MSVGQVSVRQVTGLACDSPVLDIMIRIVFCFLLLVLDLLLKPGRGHRRSWKALEGPQNCTKQGRSNTRQGVVS